MKRTSLQFFALHASIWLFLFWLLLLTTMDRHNIMTMAVEECIHISIIFKHASYFYQKIFTKRRMHIFDSFFFLKKKQNFKHIFNRNWYGWIDSVGRMPHTHWTNPESKCPKSEIRISICVTYFLCLHDHKLCILLFCFVCRIVFCFVINNNNNTRMSVYDNGFWCIIIITRGKGRYI